VPRQTGTKITKVTKLTKKEPEEKTPKKSATLTTWVELSVAPERSEGSFAVRDTAALDALRAV
jgi:hypothetical protein